MKKKNTIIHIENLCKSFNLGGTKQEVLNDMNVDIYEKDFTIIMGASGSGKSTFLYSCSGMDKPTSGKIVFCGEDISRYSTDKLAKFRKKYCGFVFQKIYLNENMSVLDNILVNGFLVKQKHSDVIERAKTLLEYMGLKPILYNKFPSQLSGGEAQRVAIARAQINNPKIVFADEPTGALNSNSTTEVLNFLTKINREGQTLVVVTHDVKTAIRANRIIYLKDGKFLDELVLSDYKEDKETERTKEVRDFLSERGW